MSTFHDDLSVDVVIPTVGRPEVARALASVRLQTHRVNSIIVVLDDPENEEAVSALLDVGDLLVVTNRLGGAAARNAGLDQVKSAFVAFLDDDDYWLPEKLESQLVEMARTGTSWAAARTIFHEQSGRIRILPLAELPNSYRDMASYLVSRPNLRHGHGYVQSSSLLLRTQLANKVRWDPALLKHQDWDFVIRVSDEAKSVPAITERPLVHVAQGSANSISRRTDLGISEEWLKKFGERISPRARGDFVTTQLLRNALSNRSLTQVGRALKVLSGTRPHAAAIIVAASGILRRAH